MKILFTGAQGTGKNTVLEGVMQLADIQCLELTPIVNISRSVQKLWGFDAKGGKGSNSAFQNKVFDGYIEGFEKYSNVISDRALTDVISYTKYQWDIGNIPSVILDTQIDRWIDFDSRHRDVIYFYFPPEIDLSVYGNDGVRSVDKEYQQNIDHTIKYLLDNFCDNEVVCVQGSLEERIAIVHDKIIEHLSQSMSEGIII